MSATYGRYWPNTFSTTTPPAPHRAFGQLTLAQADAQRPDPVNIAEHRIRRKQVLGGLTLRVLHRSLTTQPCYGKRTSRPESYFRTPQVKEVNRSVPGVRCAFGPALRGPAEFGDCPGAASFNRRLPMLTTSSVP